MEYLAELERRGIDPNFWISEEYFFKAGLKEVEKDGWLFWEDDGVAVAPPVPINPTKPFQVPIFSNFGPNTPAALWHGPMMSEELDLEYIYDPLNFMDMSGGRWAVFRKNCRKFPRRVEGEIEYKRISTDPISTHDVTELVIEWLEGMEKAGQSVIHDSETFIKYATNGFNRKGLFVNGELMGINIWDSNYAYINFRYSLCKPGQPFLNEHLRFRFYTDPVIQLTRKQMNKMVNDGGVLDRPELKAFKDKLNPVRVRTVYSWKLPQGVTA